MKQNSISSMSELIENICNPELKKTLISQNTGYVEQVGNLVVAWEFDHAGRCSATVTETKERRLEKLKSWLDNNEYGNYWEIADINKIGIIQAKEGFINPLELSESVIKDHASLYIWGEPDTSKSILTVALARAAAEAGVETVIIRWNSYLNKLRDMLKKDSNVSAEIQRVNKAEILVIDELAAKTKRPKSVTEFEAQTLHDLLSDREGSGKPTLVNCNKSPIEIRILYDEAIAGRLLNKQRTIIVCTDGSPSYR